MSNLKRKFIIQINGITESVDAVRSLNEQLRECEGIIKNLNNAKIDVKVSAATTKPTEKVSSGKSSDDKVALDIEKEKAKQIEMQTEALREQYVERERLRQANKESLDDIKQEAKGYVEVVDGVKEYANTLNGMSAELKDIKKELRDTDIDTEDFEKLTERAAELNDKLKKAEEAYGQFGRNVGNYTQSILDALDGWDENIEFNVDLNVSGAENSLNDLKAQLKELKQYWANLSPNDANFDKTAKAIKSLNQQIEDMESSLKDVGEEANSAFTGRFTTTIGGVEASFSNASEACEALRKKLVAMRVAGEENTPMYQEIIQLVRRLSKEVMIANQQVAGMNKTTQNMGKVIGVMKGLSGLAALGQGIAGFFGDGSKEMDKLIKNFASITIVIAGLKELEELINSGEGAWGKLAQKGNDALNWLFSWSDSILKATENTKEFIDAQKTLQKAQEELNEAIANASSFNLSDDMYNALAEQVQMSEQAIKGVAGLSNEWVKLQDVISDANGYSLDELGNAVSDLKARFPQLSEEIDKYTEAQIRLDYESDDAVDAFKQYQQALEEKNKAEKESDDLISSMGPKTKSFAKSLQAMGVAGRIAAAGLNLVAASIKTLGKTLIVVAALQLLAEVVDKLIDGVKWVTNAFKGWAGIMSGGEAKKLTNQLNDLQKKLEGLSKEYEIQVKIGNMGEVEAQLQRLKDQLQNVADTKITLEANSKMLEWMEQMKEELDETDSGWKDLNKTQQDAAEGMQALTKINKDFIDSIKDKTPQQQLQAIDELFKDIGLDANKLAAIESILAQDDEAIEDFLDELSDIDFDLNDIGVDGVKAFGKLGTAISKARTDAADAVGRIKSDLKTLENQNIQLQLQLNPNNATLAFQNAISSMASMAAQYGITMSKDGLKFIAKEGDATGKEIAKQLEANAALQKRITANQIADRKKQEAERAKSERERAANEAKQRAEEAKKRAEDAKKRARAEAAARIEAMEDGYNKEIALIEQKRKEEIEDAKENGKRVVDINAIYDRQILEVKKKYAKYIEETEREHTKRLEDISKDFLTSWSQIQREIEDARADTSIGDTENKNITVKQSITYDTSTKGSRDEIDAQKKYYKDMLKSEIEYLNEKEQLEIEASQMEQQRLIEDEMARFNAENEAQKNELEELERSLKDKVEAKQLSEEEANKILQQTRDKYQKEDVRSQELHNDKIQEIVDNGLTVRKNIELKYNEDRKKATAASLEEQRQVTQNFYNDIDKIMERTQKRNTNNFGFINYKEYRQSLNDALESTNTVAEQIEQDKADLQDALDANKISFDDFQNAKNELDDFAEDVNDKAKEIKDALNGSFNSWIQGVMNNVNQYASVLGGMFDTISEMYNRSLDAQQNKLDKQQELLDKELEMIEENLQKQEEITEQHKDKVNTIEDELKSARGDRRQALIDQLAAERNAQEESIKKEKQLTEEKKKQAQKQEELKKQQDALDKKRKKNEKRAAITQSIINTFTSVSNALAVPPFYVGLALSSLALSLGVANTAQIASQQYGKGGKLDGPSHKDGGIPVGNTGITVEGNEYIIRKESTIPNLPLLEYINSSQRRLTKDDLVRFYDNGKTPLINRPMTAKFAEGGELPQLSVDVKSLINNAQTQQDDRPLVVSVVDIVNQAENLRQVRVLAGDIENE